MKYDIEALRRKMLVKYPFFGSVVANVKYKEEEKISTAATDGEVIYYNPKFLEGLSSDEQTFVFAHEVCHIAFNHILRSEGKNPQVWNIATDGVINQFLMKDGLKMPEGCVDIKDAINYDAEKLYKKLLKEMPQNQGQPQDGQDQSNGQSGQSGNSGDSQGTSGDQNTQQSSSGSGSSGEEDKQKDSQNKEGQGSGQSPEEDEQKNAGHDSHEMWADAVKRHKEKEKEENGSSQDKKDEKPDKKEDKAASSKEEKAKEEVEKKQKELEKMGEKEAFDKNREEKKKELEKLREELANKASQAGVGSNRDIRKIDGIGYSKPLIDWRYVLRETIKYDVDWSYKNASIEDGVVLANLEEIPFPETEIVLDTSGSVSETLLKNFLRECKNILKYSKLKVGCFDYSFYGFTEIRNEEDIEKMKFEGGGGTNFDAAVNAFSNRVENKIIFTDGEADMPRKSVNAVWLVYGSHRINPPGGKVIYITADQLRNLYSLQVEPKKLTRKL